MSSPNLAPQAPTILAPSLFPRTTYLTTGTTVSLNTLYLSGVAAHFGS